MKCQVVSIGNELLMGDTINTNASWLGQFLTGHGMEVDRIHTIGDDLNLIKETIRQSMKEADLVITTGGLGPTHDDLTKKAVQEIFESDLVVHQPTLDFIKNAFEKRSIPFTRSNYEQAKVPENCEVLFNKQGTAPGMWFESGRQRLAVLPGVPYEMEHLMNQHVLSKIKQMAGSTEVYYSRYLLTAGVGESTLSDEVIGSLDGHLDKDVSVAYLPNLQGVRIRISGAGSSREEVLKRIGPVTDYICNKARLFIVGEGKELTLSKAVGNVLRDHRLTIATAESCTGGMMSDQLTNISGSSDYMLGGIVAYANEVKKKLLEVTDRDLSKHGAVSKPVALQIAKGVAELMGADIGVSTTGIAGPGGGTPEKPVGTIWIGYWSRNRHFALKTLFTNDRIVNKERSVAVALETVRRSVLDIDSMPYGLKPHSA